MKVTKAFTLQELSQILIDAGKFPEFSYKHGPTNMGAKLQLRPGDPSLVHPIIIFEMEEKDEP